MVYLDRIDTNIIIIRSLFIRKDLNIMDIASGRVAKDPKGNIIVKYPIKNVTFSQNILKVKEHDHLTSIKIYLNLVGFTLYTG